MKKYLVLFLLMVALLSGSAFYVYRLYTKSFSPASEAKLNTEKISINLNYCRPYKKGRQIFGGLVPYDTIWRTGANEATEISFNKDVLVAGKEIKAGRYALFTIPSDTIWTIILNDELGQWGAFEYKESRDMLRAQVKPESLSKPVEQFTIRFTEISNGAEMSLMWDQTKVVVPIILNQKALADPGYTE